MFKLFENKEKYNYFEEFTTIASLIVDASNIILINLKNYSLNSLGKPIQEILENDKKISKMSKALMSYLYEDFLPPIEREDLISLSHLINALSKETSNLIISLDVYQIEDVNPNILKMMELVLNGNKQIPKIMKELENFKHPKKLLPEIEEVRVIVHNMQMLQVEMVKQLYSEKTETIKIMKYTKIYEQFEKIQESLKQLMDSLEAVIIKNT